MSIFVFVIIKAALWLDMNCGKSFSASFTFPDRHCYFIALYKLFDQGVGL